METTEFFEEWKLIDGEELRGYSYSGYNREKHINEYFNLKKFGGRCAYIAVAEDQTITLLQLVE